MAERACRLKLSLETRPSLAVCRVTVSNGSGVVTVTPVGASVSFVHFTSAPVATSCGLWDAALTLAPIRLQPVPEMTVNLRLTNRETGRIADFVLRPGAGLAGPWALSSNGKSPAPTFLADEEDEDDDGEDDVIVFEGCIPAWVLKDPKYKIDPDQDCAICPEDDSSDGDSDVLARPEL
jgi:hypothetical protein